METKGSTIDNVKQVPLANKPARSTRSIQKDVIITKSFSPMGNKYANKLVKKSLIDNKAYTSTSPNVMKDVKRILIENGLTLDYIINTYKSVLLEEHDKPKASDVLKALGRLEKLHGITNKTIEKQEDIPLSVNKALHEGKIDNFIINITNKTNDYISKLEDIQDGELVEDPTTL